MGRPGIRACLGLLLAASARATDVTVPTLPAGTTHWTVAGSPYVINPAGGTLTIPTGSTLQIDAGVSVQLHQNVSLLVNGTGSLLAVGSSGSPITFTTDTPGTRWGGIRCQATASLAMSDCVLQDHGSFPVEGSLSQVADLFETNMFVASANGRFNAIRLITSTLASSATLALPDAGFCYITAPSAALWVQGTAPVLTIADGTVVKFAPGGYLRISFGPTFSGGLRANDVIFTSSSDDAVGGGDTDGAGASQGEPGQWRGLRFERNTLVGPGQTSVTSCEVRYAGGSGEQVGVQVSNAEPPISDCSLHHHLGTGLRLDGTSSGVAIQANHLHDNSGYKLVAPLAAMANLIGQNVVTPSATPRFSGFLVLAGAVNADVTLPQPPIGMCYVLDGTVSIALTRTLTLPSRTVFKLDIGASLVVQGRLVAAGELTPPVTGTEEQEEIWFTSIRDDEVWGDTNGDGATTSPAPGDWNQVQLLGNQNSELRGVVFRYGGRSGVGQLALANTGSPPIPNLLIERCFFYIEQPTGGGIHLMSSKPRIQECGFLGSPASYGIENASAIEVDATGNWWGAASGPNDNSPNASCTAYANAGAGVRVTDCVKYAPFLVTPGTPPVDAPRPSPASGVFALEVRPNPSVGRAEFRIRGAGDTPASLEVLDATGRRVWAGALAPDGRDERVLGWDLTGPSGRRVAPGLYLVRAVLAGSRVVRGKLVVDR